MLTFIVTWLVIGLIEFLANLVLRGGHGIVFDIILGLVGAVIGGLIIGTLLGFQTSSFIGHILVAFIGAVLLLLAVRLVDRQRSVFR